MWPLQSDHSAQAGVRKTEVFPHANQSFWETYRRSLSLLKLITRNLLSRCFVPCLGLQFVCVMWVRKSAPLFHFSQQKLHGKYNMGLADFSSISCVSGISRMISFCSGWRENYRWAWKQREERSDWQRVVSVWGGQQREIWFPSTQTIAQASKEHVWVGQRGRNRKNSSQLSIFAWSDCDKVPTHWESLFFFTSGFCVLWVVSKFPACYGVVFAWKCNDFSIKFSVLLWAVFDSAIQSDYLP